MSGGGSIDYWIDHVSVQSWYEPDRWVRYFEEAERVLGARLSHLGTRDPPSRRPATIDEAAALVCSFKPGENRRCVFGKFEAVGAEFTIELCREINVWPNALTWTISPVCGATTTAITDLFKLGNASLNPFFAYTDSRAIVAGTKKPSGGIDVAAELPGMFWGTFFNAKYVDFFGATKLREIIIENGFPRIDFEPDGSATIWLCDEPGSVPLGSRQKYAAVIGGRAFMDPYDPTEKEPGEFALSFQDLKSV